MDYNCWTKNLKTQVSK